jgi:outer membrane protein assembly factor BamB
VVHDDVVYVIGDRFRNTAMAIRAGGKGDVSSTNVIWKINKGSNVCSPVYHQGYLYWGKDDRGIVYCVQADTGKLVYEEQLDPAPDGFYASPVVADGKIYYVSRTKGAYVLEASPKFHLLAHNTLGDTTYFHGSPVITDGHILLRSDRYLYCLGSTK